MNNKHHDDDYQKNGLKTGLTSMLNGSVINIYMKTDIDHMKDADAKGLEEHLKAKDGMNTQQSTHPGRPCYNKYKKASKKGSLGTGGAKRIKGRQQK